MKKRHLRVSCLSNVVYLSDGRGAGGARMVADNLAVFCLKRDETGRWVDIGPSAVELLDGAETLLPRFRPEEFGDVWGWMPRRGAPEVAYDRERDILRLFNAKTPVTTHVIADNLTVTCDEYGYPVSVEIIGAAALLLPIMLPVPEYLMADAAGR